MFFPYFHNITIEDLYDNLTYYEFSELPDLRNYFRQLTKYSWRIIIRSNPFQVRPSSPSGKLTFPNFAEFYQFVKFAYIMLPSLCLTVYYQVK